MAIVTLKPPQIPLHAQRKGENGFVGIADGNFKSSNIHVINCAYIRY